MSASSVRASGAIAASPKSAGMSGSARKPLFDCTAPSPWKIALGRSSPNVRAATAAAPRKSVIVASPYTNARRTSASSLRSRVATPRKSITGSAKLKR